MRMNNDLSNERREIIKDMLLSWMKTRDIMSEVKCSSKLIAEVNKEIQLEKLVKQYQEDNASLTLSEIDLLKKKQSLTDKNSLVNRQIRAINRKDNFYEEFMDYIDEKIVTFALPEQKEFINTYNTDTSFKILLLSDVHADEVISLPETSGNEEYNFEIFKNRLKSLEQQVIANQLKDKTEYLTVMFIGDIISWVIHEELYENWNAGIFEVLTKVSLCFAEFFNNLSAYYKKIYIYTKPGNHWRMSKQIKFKRTDENYDNIIYSLVKGLLPKTKFQFTVSTQFIDIITINKKKFGIVHWDKINTKELIKQYQLDYLLMWHIHTAKIESYLDAYIISNWAFPRSSWFVNKGMSHKWNPPQQVLLTFDEDMNLSFKSILLKDNTEWYNISLNERGIMMWDEYLPNMFELKFGNYR